MARDSDQGNSHLGKHTSAISELLNTPTEVERTVGYRIPGWVHCSIYELATQENLKPLEAYYQLIADGLPLDHMWAIEAAMYEGRHATKH